MQAKIFRGLMQRKYLDVLNIQSITCSIRPLLMTCIRKWASNTEFLPIAPNFVWVIRSLPHFSISLLVHIRVHELERPKYRVNLQSSGPLSPLPWHSCSKLSYVLPYFYTNACAKKHPTDCTIFNSSHDDTSLSIFHKLYWVSNLKNEQSHSKLHYFWRQYDWFKSQTILLLLLTLLFVPIIDLSTCKGTGACYHSFEVFSQI